MHISHRSAVVAAVLGIASFVALSHAAEPTVRVERFDRDPAWDGHHNHIEPKAPKTVRQSFGYSPTHHAGKAAGEIGGTIWRCSTPASYADAITPKTLNDRLSASGTFAITATSGSSGAFLGFFKADQPEGGRQNTLGIRFAGEGEGARITFQLVTATNQACGTKVTPWVVDKTKKIGEGRKVRPPSIRNDGTHYAWTLDYDPDANNGNGQMRFTIKSDSATPEPFEGKPFTVDLPAGYKNHGTTFDRFGLVNSMRPGNGMTIWLDDLAYDGKAQDFAGDPGWIGSGNQRTYERREEGGAHDFGFSAATNHAGGASAGELGGMIWRSGDYGYYADRVGPLSLNDRLEASGKVVLSAGPPDSGMHIGWFNGGDKEWSPIQAGQFLGVKIGGPTRVGHYFLPAYATVQAGKPEKGDRKNPPNISVDRNAGPVLVPQQVFDWKLTYDPAANDGAGEITVTLGADSITLPLKPGDKAKGATFDRFGLFTTNRGGSYVKIYFDDLSYTATATR